MKFYLEPIQRSLVTTPRVACVVHLEKNIFFYFEKTIYPTERWRFKFTSCMIGSLCTKTNICPKTLRPKWGFVKSVPGQLDTVLKDSAGLRRTGGGTGSWPRSASTRFWRESGTTAAAGWRCWEAWPSRPRGFFVTSRPRGFVATAPAAACGRYYKVYWGQFFKAKFAPTWQVCTYTASLHLCNSDAYSLVGA
jgi:hypothetical protein